MTNELRITSFVALGDSVTEGLNDDRPDGTMRGWADRVAEQLARDDPGFVYANLAVRGKVLQQIIDEQLPAAIAAQPDLIGFSAGGNDILHVPSDPDEVAARYEEAVVALRATGARVLVFTGYDVGTTPVFRLIRGKVAIYNENLRVIAARHGCDLVDLWGLAPLHDRRAFSPDRLHPSPEGHERVARLVAQVLGHPTADPDEPWPARPTLAAGRREDLAWTREYFLPWVGRHLRGRSSGDGIPPKRPELIALDDVG